MRDLNTFKISLNFYLYEFECRHCQAVMVEYRLIDMLQALRQKLGSAIVITSGYRCPSYNRAVGGAENSFHTKGMAADFYVPGTELTIVELADLCESWGFGGVGAYVEQGFVHVDSRRVSHPVRFR